MSGVISHIQECVADALAATRTLRYKIHCNRFDTLENRLGRRFDIVEGVILLYTPVEQAKTMQSKALWNPVRLAYRTAATEFERLGLKDDTYSEEARREMTLCRLRLFQATGDYGNDLLRRLGECTWPYAEQVNRAIDNGTYTEEVARDYDYLTLEADFLGNMIHRTADGLTSIIRDLQPRAPLRILSPQ